MFQDSPRTENIPDFEQYSSSKCETVGIPLDLTGEPLSCCIRVLTFVGLVKTYLYFNRLLYSATILNVDLIQIHGIGTLH